MIFFKNLATKYLSFKFNVLSFAPDVYKIIATLQQLLHSFCEVYRR